jgi:hypothetical protein
MPIGAFRLNTLAAAIASATNSITATGGTISYFTLSSINYKVHTISTAGSNNFIVSATTGTPTADLLLVGGGGAGGGVGTSPGGGGGGGGGAVVSGTGIPISAQTYIIGIGAGGTGVSGAAGNAGNQSSALLYLANGGGAGTFNSAATNGGGSGTNSATSYTSTTGTHPYKGGNSFGSVTTSLRAGGGGAGAGGAGTDAASAIGGNGGLPIQNNFDGQNLWYAGGGGGSGNTTQGQAYSSSGTLGNATSAGAGRTSTGAGGTNTTGTYGGGGGGAYTTTTTAAAGGGGRQGIAIIRYPLTGEYVYFISSATGSAATIAMPTVQTGDIVILNNNATATTTAPTAVTPSGWNNIINTSVNSGTALRMMVHYKVITNGATESGTTITGMSGTGNRYNILVYRPSKSFSISTSITSANYQAAVGTTAAITNQTLGMGVSGPSLAFAFYYSSTSSATFGSTTAGTQDITNGATGNVKTFEASDSTISFATSTISLTNATSSTMALASFRLGLA